MGTVTVTGSLMARDWRDCGSCTGKPCCIIGAATMKITSSTSMTSTSGTTLISASDVDTRIARARRPPDRLGGCWIGSSFGMVHVKFRSAIVRNSSEKSSISFANAFTWLVRSL